MNKKVEKPKKYEVWTKVSFLVNADNPKEAENTIEEFIWKNSIITGFEIKEILPHVEIF